MSTPGSLIVLGSEVVSQAKNVEFYDDKANVWTKVLKLDTGDRIDYKSIVFSGDLMLIGGAVSSIPVTTVTKYNFDTEEMTVLPSLSVGARNTAVAVLHHRLYVIGGINQKTLNRVERCTPDNYEWETVQPMLSPRDKCGVAVLDDDIYAIGGTDGHYRLETVEAFSTVTETWRKCASMNSPRHGVAVASLGGFIYAVGGGAQRQTLASAERYDPQIDQWVYIQSANIHRNWAEAEVLNNSIVVAGGFSEEVDGDKLDDVESYNPEKDEWTTLAPLLEARGYLNLVYVLWKPSK